MSWRLLPALPLEVALSFVVAICVHQTSHLVGFLLIFAHVHVVRPGGSAYHGRCSRQPRRLKGRPWRQLEEAEVCLTSSGSLSLSVAEGSAASFMIFMNGGRRRARERCWAGFSLCIVHRGTEASALFFSGCIEFWWDMQIRHFDGKSNYRLLKKFMFETVDEMYWQLSNLT